MNIRAMILTSVCLLLAAGFYYGTAHSQDSPDENRRDRRQQIERIKQQISDLKNEKRYLLDQEKRKRMPQGIIDRRIPEIDTQIRLQERQLLVVSGELYLLDGHIEAMDEKQLRITVQMLLKHVIALEEEVESMKENEFRLLNK